MKLCIISEKDSHFKTEYIERDVPVPGANEILIKWHATSLNYHDYLVARALIKTYGQRIPMSDGAGEVVAKLNSSFINEASFSLSIEKIIQCLYVGCQ